MQNGARRRNTGPGGASGGKRSSRPATARQATKQGYTHTHAAVYTVILTSLGCLFTDSTQSILDKYHINRKWFYLYGALFFSAYLYVRPYIRHNIGSAASGRINFYSIYLAWLLSAWVYHLPGIAALGIDVKADVSLMLLVFFASILTLALLNAAYNLAVSFKLINRRLFNFRSSQADRINIVLVNSMSLAVSCSTYYSFCGNTAESVHTHIESICLSLRPVKSSEFPTLSEWVFYGESNNDSVSAVPTAAGELPAVAEKIISPVFTLWLTMVALYTANCLADHWACCSINATTTSDLPRRSNPLPGMQRAVTVNDTCGMDRSFSAEAMTKRLSSDFKAAVGMVNEYGTVVASSLGWSGGAGGGSGRATPSAAGAGESSEATPDFLPMVAWFSGTSADLLKTFFDLIVSLKIFLGRFDMREMQVAASAADINRPRPNGRDGDGFTYEQFSERSELWLDFCADTGDGGDATYAVARAMATPHLEVNWAEGVKPMQGSSRCRAKAATGSMKLPRGDLMLIGGDLAYPNPSDYSYERRLFKPFEDALPPPRHYHPGRVVVHKPDLPPGHPAFDMCDCDSPRSAAYEEVPPTEVEHTKTQSSWSCRALRRYEGPQCFAIPGNHDWIDGLETFMRHITCKGWLGGWLLPQEKSYFALHLPHGYWVFALDLGLVNDIDIYQYRYFAQLVESRLGPGDSVVLITHQPLWLLGWFHQRREGSNLNQLVHGHLRGKVPVHLAGDLHFYMRHSLSTPAQAEPSKPADPDAGSARGLRSRLRSLVTTSVPPERPKAEAAGTVSAGDSKRAAGGGWAAKGLSPQASYANLQDASLAGTGDAGERAALPQSHPQHLIVCGAGGAFLHPTHIFAEASWLINRDSAAESVARMLKCEGCGSWSRGTSTGSSPRGYSLTVPPGWEGLFPMMPAPVRQLPAPVAGPTAPAATKYTCQAAFPAPAESRRLGRGNIHLFRRQNMKFDVIGGLWYFLLVAGGVPCCGSMAALLEADSFSGALSAFGTVFAETVQRILLESYVSLAATVGLFLATFAFAKAGGIGSSAGRDGDSAAAGSASYAETYRIRSGGLSTRLAVAAVHSAAHLSVAISLMLGLDLAIETCVQHGVLGGEGYHSLFNWYRAFEAQHFPDPNGLRDKLARYSLHAYPDGLRCLMAVFDIPEAIALGRVAVCSAGWGSLTRLQYLGYYAGVLAYYWVLATPAIAAIFGCYLYIAVCWFHVHFDEGFSSMRLPDYKGFLRMHISPEGELNIWSLAMRRVPRHWREDPRWAGFLGGGDKRIPSHKAKYPCALAAGRRRHPVRGLPHRDRGPHCHQQPHPPGLTPAPSARMRRAAAPAWRTVCHPP
eukprot:jgi/Tetstr1/460228/TSEL_005543.t1